MARIAIAGPRALHQSAASQEMDIGRSGASDVDRADAHERLEGIRQPARAVAAHLEALPLAAAAVRAWVCVCRCRHAIFVRRQCHGMAHRRPAVPALCMRLSEDATTALSIQHCDGPKGQGLRVAQL